MTNSIAWSLTIACLLPLVGFIILIFFGRKIAEPKAGILASFLMITSAVISVISAIKWVLGSGESFAAQIIRVPWFNIGDVQVFAGVRVDSLTIVMFTMVSVVSSCIFVYSVGYMYRDKRFPRFFTYLSLFAFSMLGLVLSESLICLFIFWELVGLCSYFLIGFWFEKQSASDAAKKAFIVNRVGDFLFLIGIAVMLSVTRTVGLEEVFSSVRNGIFSDHSTLLTFAGICLFFGAVGKSAQFPLHVWLPDAMEGPTPVSALIHAATMVAAGVYMVGRIYPILTPDALLVIAYIGGITLFGSSLIAIVMTDIKRALAYSTISQLGYMVLALGVGGWVAGLFHLITHACFKALLFLGSGSVIHGCGGEQDIRKMGALHKKMPITSLTFLVATLAIAGFPFLSGFYSKDAILASALLFVSKHNSHYLLFIFPAVAACITAFYMMRLYLLTFFTSPKDQHVHHHAHESPVVMWLPLVILAILSLGVGWGSVIPEGKSLGKGQYEFHGGRGLAGLIASAQPDWTMSWQMNDLAEMKKIPASHPEESSHTDEHSTSHESHQLHKLVTILATSAMILGFGFAFVVYRFRWISAEKSASLLRPIYLLLWNKFYVDELYRATVVAGVLKLAAIGKWIDLNILDGIADGSARWVVRWAFFSGLVLDNRGVDGAVNGTAAVVMAGGNIARKGQTGRVRNYLLMTLTLIALTIAVSVFWMIL